MQQVIIRSLIISLYISMSSYFFAGFISSDIDFSQYCRSESGQHDIECSDLQDEPEGTIENLTMLFDFLSFLSEFSTIFISCLIYGYWALLRPIRKRTELQPQNTP